MPFFFLVLFLLQLFGEGVVFPTALAVFFFPDVVAVENVQLVFFFKLCNAVLDDALDSLMVFFMVVASVFRVCFPFGVCIFALKHIFIKAIYRHRSTKDMG